MKAFAQTTYLYNARNFTHNDEQKKQKKKLLICIKSLAVILLNQPLNLYFIAN